MKRFGKNILCIVLALLLCIGLCACGEGNNDSGGNESNPNGFESDLPETIFGTWYPHPEVSDLPIEISNDGVCTIDGQTMQWDVESTNEDEVVLTANGGAYHFTFTQLSSGFPFLSTSNFGMAVKEPELWNYMTEWCNSEGGAFTLSIEELMQSGCKIYFNDSGMTIEVLENDQVTHTVHFFENQATVIDAEGNSTLYLSDYEGGSNNTGEESTNALEKYQQAVKDLQNVLAGGDMTDYVDSDDVHHMISGAEAIEKLYKTFTELQTTHDVSEYLSRIRKVDNVLVKYYDTMGLDHIARTNNYNAYGQLLGIHFEEAINTGEYIYYGYDETGKMTQVSVCGLPGVCGAPIFDTNGRIAQLKITSPTTGKEYTAPISYDEQGRICRVDIPFVIMGVDDNEADFNEFYEFLYDENGRLIQYSQTQQAHDGVYENTATYKKMGFYHKEITECYYNGEGKIEQTINHVFDMEGNGASAWRYVTTTYDYNSVGNLETSAKVSMPLYYNIPGQITPEEETDRVRGICYDIFHSQEFVNSIGNGFLESIKGHYKEADVFSEREYEYGSIYIYQAEE